MRGHKNIEHGGAWQGFTSHIARYVDDRLTVIVLTNMAGANPTAIAHTVAGIYVPALAPAADKRSEEKVLKLAVWLKRQRWKGNGAGAANAGTGRAIVRGTPQPGCGGKR